MTDNELLLAISDIMDKKLQPLKEEIKQLKLQNENIIIPRLQNIENCYTSTYDRYKNSVEDYEAMKADIQIMKQVIQEHSEKSKKIS